MAERDREILVQLHLSEIELQVLMRILGSPNLSVPGVQNMRTCVALHDKLRLKASQLMTLKKQASRAGLQSVAKTAASNKAKSAATKSPASSPASPASKEPAPAPGEEPPSAAAEPVADGAPEAPVPEAPEPEAAKDAPEPAPATADADEKSE